MGDAGKKVESLAKKYTIFGLGDEDNIATDTFKSIGDFFQGPDVPDPITPDPLPQQGSEGIRAGETARIARRRTLGRLELSRGQNRADDSTLGVLAKTLG